MVENLESNSNSRIDHREGQSENNPIEEVAPNSINDLVDDMAAISLIDRRFPLLLVLDLNGTLINRIVKRKRTKELANVTLPSPHVVVNGAWVYCRPKLNEFLEYIFSNFYVATWTSATKRTSDGLLDVLFTPEQIKELVFSWDRDDCSDISGPENDYEAKKNLTRVWEKAFVKKANKPYISVPINENVNKFSGNRKNIAFSSKNTILIDDSPGKATYSPYSCLLIPSFSVLESNYDNDDAFTKIIEYLENIKTNNKEIVLSKDMKNKLTENILDFERHVPGTPLDIKFDVKKIIKNSPCF